MSYEKEFFVLLFLLAMTAAVEAADKPVSFEKAHNAFMETSEVYRQLDAALNECWSRLKSVSTEAEYKIALQEQRNWLKQRSRILEELCESDGSSEEDAALQMLAERIAVINARIAMKDSDNISCKPVRSKEHYHGRTVIAYYMNHSMPIARDDYIIYLEKQSRYDWVKAGIKDFAVRSLRKYISNQKKDGYLRMHSLNEAIDYLYGMWAEAVTRSESISVVHEDDRLVCVAGTWAYDYGDPGTQAPMAAPNR